MILATGIIIVGQIHLCRRRFAQHDDRSMIDRGDDGTHMTISRDATTIIINISAQRWIGVRARERSRGWNDAINDDACMRQCEQ